jgi:hypothetical protein
VARLEDPDSDMTWAYLEGLFTWLVRCFVYYLIILRPREMFMLERIKRALGEKSDEDRLIQGPHECIPIRS